ncbi:MAG: glucosamine-6-phosphate deaminase [Deltaproteobacteria bacterium]|nr:glucosamine-6-phosphate deaminase [Deltaproteobacteria bacterium]
MNTGIVVARDYEQMSEYAAGLVQKSIRAGLAEKHEFVLGLATGGSPVGLYERLALAANRGRIDSSRLKTFNLDEYIGLKGRNPQERVLNKESYCYFMVKHLFSKLNDPPSSFQVPWANLVDYKTLKKELIGNPDDWRRMGTDSGNAIIIRKKAQSPYLSWIKRYVLDSYARLITTAGGIDLQVLGVGGRGHVAFHEAGIPFSLKGLLMVELDRVTVEHAVQDGHFPSSRQAPKMALTMSIDLVFKARQVVLLASGSRKTDAIARGLLGPVDCEVPVSYVQTYAKRGGKVILVLDREAAAGIMGRHKELRANGFTVKVI